MKKTNLFEVLENKELECIKGGNSSTASLSVTASVIDLEDEDDEDDEDDENPIIAPAGTIVGLSSAGSTISFP